jgi:hypothetical protein
MDWELLSKLKGGTKRERRAAAYKIGKSADPDMVPYLIEAYGDPDPILRRNVIEALCSIGTDEAMQFANLSEAEKQQKARLVQRTGSMSDVEESTSLRIPEPPAEAQEHFDRARHMDVEDDDILALREQAAEYALAISKANGFYPSAHALLGFTLAQLGEESKSRQELNVALGQMNCHVFARIFLLFWDIESLGIPGFFQSRSGSDLLDLTMLGVGSIFAKSKLQGLSRKIDELIKAYPAYLSQYTGDEEDVDTWVAIAELMLVLHDLIQDIKGLPRKGRIAKAVLDTPWHLLEHTIAQSEDKQELIADVMRRAEGRVLLAKA